MKKSLLFILLTVAIIAFGVIQQSNIKSTDISSNQDFVEKWQKKSARALGYFEWRQKLITNVETGEIETNDHNKAIQEINLLSSNNSNKTDAVDIEWDPRGPDNQGGRTRTMLFDKDDADLIYTGSISGGLFKSTDAGYSWERVESYFEHNAAIMSMTQTIDGSIFVGTGEALSGGAPNGTSTNTSIAGNGIYKSSDAGATWSHINATNVSGSPSFSSEWSSVRILEASPTNASILFAGNNSGLRVSTNADAAQPDFSNISSIPGAVTDIVITSDGVDGWCASNGRVYKSTGDLVSQPWSYVSFNTSSRAQLAVSTVDVDGNYIVYVSFTDGPGCLDGVWKSEDKGDNWEQIVFAGGLDPFGQPSGGAGCQGWYDHCLAVNPVDKDKLYIGGITFYAWGPSSGGLKRADKISTEGADQFDPDYIHADKHGIFFNQHDETGNTMFVVGDGGITKCLNANSGFPDEMIYSESNRNFLTLQCYSIGSGKYGEVIAGAQDNGTQYVDGTGISPTAAKEVSSGDGVAGAEISNLSINYTFSGVYFGNIKRSTNNGESSSNFVSPVIDKGGCGHITCMPLSGTVTCSSLEESGQRFIYPFLLLETINRKTPRYDAFVYAKNEIINLPGGGTVTVKDTINPGNVIDHDNFSFVKIPSLHTQGLDLFYDLDETLFPGDTSWFKTNFDAKYIVPSTCGGLFVCINPLQDGISPDFFEISISNQSSISNLDYSTDGDMVAAVASSQLIIMKGWDDFDASNQIIDQNSISVAGNLSGVAVDKNDASRVLVSQQGYGGVNKIWLVTNALSATPTVTSVQGNLPIMPIYDCIIDQANSDRFIIGTEFGIFATNDGGATWTEENTGIGARIPVFRLSQEWVNNGDCFLLSAGSVGGGMYSSTSLTDCDVVFKRPAPVDIKDVPNVEVNDIIVYPNPVLADANIAFNLTSKASVTIKVIDLTGKEMNSQTFNNLPSGKQSVSIDVSNLASSTYLTVLTVNNKNYGKKLFIKK